MERNKKKGSKKESRASKSKEKKTTRSKSKKRDSDSDTKIKRPTNAWFFYRKEKYDEFKKEHPEIEGRDRIKELSKIFNELEDKSKWEKMAEDDRLRYEREMKAAGKEVKPRTKTEKSSKANKEDKKKKVKPGKSSKSKKSKPKDEDEDEDDDNEDGDANESENDE